MMLTSLKSLLNSVMVLFVFSAITIAYDGETPQGFQNLNNAISLMCNEAKSMIPIVAMLMFVVAGVIYAAGQILGAETRARANVWATACLTGAIIGILIVIIAPPVAGTMLGEDIACEISA